MKNLLVTLAVALSIFSSSSSFAAEKKYSFYVVSADGSPAKMRSIKTQSGVPVEFAGILSKNGKPLFTLVRVPSKYGIQNICYKGECKRGSPHDSSALAVRF